MLVVGLNQQAKVMKKRHLPLHKAQLIPRFLHELCGDFILALQTSHQGIEYIVTMSNYQNVVHMYQNKASSVWSFENAGVWCMGCHTKLRLEKACYILMP